MKRTNRSGAARPTLWAAFALSILNLNLTGPAAARNSYVWKNVQISGANAWVTGIIAHPGQKGLFYIRTDVGGCYRWDSKLSKWIPITDFLTFPQRNNFGGEGIAIDPSNPQIVYYAGGAWTSGGNGAIFKSTNQGATWKKLAIDIPMGGNEDRRWAGERLMVSPSNSMVILFGSRTKGLWRSADGGVTWSNVTAIPVVHDDIGVQSVAFDASAPGIAYAAVSQNGVYKSTDDGGTWALIGGNITPFRLAAGLNGALWYTHGKGVSKYFGGTWLDCTAGGPASYCGLAVNPADPNDVIVSKGAAMTSTLWRTHDGGATWIEKATHLANPSIPWFTNLKKPYGISNIVFDPYNTNSVWEVDGLGMWRTDSIASDPATFALIDNGREEDVALAIATPPAGIELFTGIADVDGFAHDNALDAYPSRKLGSNTPYIGHTLSIAYQETNPSNMVRTGAQGSLGPCQVAKSTDNGKNWTSVPFAKDNIPLRCAMSATDSNDVVIMCNASRTGDKNMGSWRPVPATDPWRVTKDGGATWNAISGLPTPPAAWGMWYHQQPLASDTVNGAAFYYSDTNGKVYRSTDGGASFAWMNTGAGQLLPAKPWLKLAVRPGVEGDLWESVDNDNADYPNSTRTRDEGLYHSSDGGATWSRVNAVTRAWLFCFGKAPSATAAPVMYLYGRIKGANTEGIYRSLDLGKTWADITDRNNRIGDVPQVMEGSRRNFGIVFIGTSGRGYFHGAPR